MQPYHYSASTFTEEVDFDSTLTSFCSCFFIDGLTDSLKKYFYATRSIGYRKNRKRLLIVRKVLICTFTVRLVTNFRTKSSAIVITDYCGLLLSLRSLSFRSLQNV
jgi:hypothetical protein